jgi:hypothetical protein
MFSTFKSSQHLFFLLYMYVRKALNVNLLGAYSIAIYGDFGMRLEQLGAVCSLGSFFVRDFMASSQPLALKT